MVVIPLKKHVNKDGSLNPLGVLPSQYNDVIERLTDLVDVDITPLYDPEPGYMFLLAYVPNEHKKFSFVKMKIPT